VRLLGTLKIMTVQNVPLEILLLYPTLVQYRRFIVQVAAIYDHLQQLDLLATIIANVATTFDDLPTIEQVSVQQSYLTEYRLIVQEAIDVIQTDRQYLQRLSNSDAVEIINRAVGRDYRLGWYWKGITTFDYILG
jgi:hypothetical protein